MLSKVVGAHGDAEIDAAAGIGEHRQGLAWRGVLHGNAIVGQWGEGFRHAHTQARSQLGIGKL